jgi:replicative DNA helicase
MKKTYELFASEYERGVLSLAYRHIDVLTGLQQRITSEYFLYPPNKIVYIALSTLMKEKSINKIDLETLYVECTKLGLNKTGVDASYLGIITQGGYDKENLEFYIQKVEDAFLKYSLHKTLESSYNTLLKNRQDGENFLNAETLINNTSANLSNLISFTGKAIEGVSFAKRARPYVMEAAENPTDVKGIRTGFNTLDKTINGLMPGSLTIIAGVAKAGKSTVLLNIADYVSIQGNIEEPENPDKVLQPKIPVLFISTEMYSDEDLSRQLAIRTLLEERGICNGTLFQDDKYKDILLKGVEQVESADSMYHVFLPDFSIAKVCSLIYQYKLKYNIGLAIFDYIKMSTSGDDTKDKKEYQVLGDITTELKNLAGKLHIPILSACQINSRSRLVADSDRIIRYCNNLIVFSRKEDEELEQQNFYKHGTHWLDVKVARSAGNNRIPIRFWKKCCKMQEAEPYIGEGDQETSTEYELTTPGEWERLKNEYFKVDVVSSAVGSTDNKELLEDDDDLF